MPGKQAKAATPQMLRRMLRKVSKSPLHARDQTMILLSVKAGLRACEIARLDWSMVLDARGKVADAISVRDAIVKKHGARRIPMHHDLRARFRHCGGSATALDPPCAPPAAATYGPPARSTGLPPCPGNSASKDAGRTRAGTPSSPAPRATSIVAAAASTTSSWDDRAVYRRRHAGTKALGRLVVSPALPFLVRISLKREVANSCTPTNAGSSADISATLSTRAVLRGLRAPAQTSSPGSRLTPARSECQASPARRQSCGADEGFKSPASLRENWKAWRAEAIAAARVRPRDHRRFSVA